MEFDMFCVTWETIREGMLGWSHQKRITRKVITLLWDYMKEKWNNQIMRFPSLGRNCGTPFTMMVWGRDAGEWTGVARRRPSPVRGIPEIFHTHDSKWAKFQAWQLDTTPSRAVKYLSILMDDKLCFEEDVMKTKLDWKMSGGYVEVDAKCRGNGLCCGGIVTGDNLHQEPNCPEYATSFIF